MGLCPDSAASPLVMRCGCCGFTFSFDISTYTDGGPLYMFPLSRAQLSALVDMFPDVIRSCRGCGAAIDQTAWREWAGTADEVEVMR